ncbi:U6 snRNA-associated Sm-like protein LSm2, partial [Spiromyces aspiralis]
TLVGKQVTVELKNDLCIQGTLVSVDQFLNIKLDGVKAIEEERYPHMMSVTSCFIRGSVVRYVQIPPEAVDKPLLQDAARREAQQQQQEKAEPRPQAQAAA